jgi:hypothetical protein
MTNDIFACFELNAIDAPILRGLKTYGKAVKWRDADLLNRYIVGYCVDRDEETFPPADLFEWAREQAGGVEQG